MRTPRACLLPVVAVLLLSGCGDFLKKFTGDDEDDTEQPAALVDVETRVEITKLWSRKVGKGADEHFLKLVPAHTQDRIFVVDARGNLTSVDVDDGAVLWREKMDMMITGGVGATETLALVGSEEGDVLAYTTDEGVLSWRAKVSSEVLAPPQGASGVVVVRTLDGKVFGLDADDGTHLWNYARTVPTLTLRGTSSPVIDGDTVIVGFDGGRVSALELLTGKLIWETSVTLASGRSQLERMVDIDSSPVIIGNDVYVATFQGRLASVALESGRITWNRDISSHAGLASDGGGVYISDDESYVWALERDAGEVLWKQEGLFARNATAPAILGEFIVVGDFEGYLHWMDQRDGEFVARQRPTKKAILAAPLVIGETVYVYGSDGVLSAYALSE